MKCIIWKNKQNNAIRKTHTERTYIIIIITTTKEINIFAHTTNIKRHQLLWEMEELIDETPECEPTYTRTHGHKKQEIMANTEYSRWCLSMNYKRKLNKSRCKLTITIEVIVLSERINLFFILQYFILNCATRRLNFFFLQSIFALFLSMHAANTCKYTIYIMYVYIYIVFQFESGKKEVYCIKIIFFFITGPWTLHTIWRYVSSVNYYGLSRLLSFSPGQPSHSQILQ